MPSDSKKISTLIPPDLLSKMEDSGLSQTKIVLEALNYYFSEDRLQIKSYKQQIIEGEQKIAILEARLMESDKFRDLLEAQNEMNKAHISQVQTLITTMENERRSREDIIRQKEEKILLLEEGVKNKKWWKFW